MDGKNFQTILDCKLNMRKINKLNLSKVYCQELDQTISINKSSQSNQINDKQIASKQEDINFNSGKNDR
jgi:hypothetical protein